MPTNVMTPRFETSDVSFRATAAVTGKRFVRPSGDRTGGLGLSTDLENVYRMAHPTADGQSVAGVAAYDVASGKRGPCKGQPGRVVVMTSGASITAGAHVMTNNGGKAIPWVSAASEANQKVGLAMSGASGADVDVEIKLY